MGIFNRIRTVLGWMWKGYPKGPPPRPIIIHNLRIGSRQILSEAFSLTQIPHFWFDPSNLTARINEAVQSGETLGCTWVNPNAMTVMFVVCWQLEWADGYRTILTSSGKLAPQSAGSFVLPVARGGLLLRVYMSAEQI